MNLQTRSLSRSLTAAAMSHMELSQRRTMDTPQALLAILTALVAALIWLVKRMTVGAERMAKQRDKEIALLIEGLTTSVDAFANFKNETTRGFAETCDLLRDMQKTQTETLTELRRMHELSTSKDSA